MMAITRTLAFVILMSGMLPADEGMWLFNALPMKRLKESHNFVPSDQWAQSLQLASVRFNSGGSGSFVSSNGLVLTNHHVASDTLHKLSTPERNLIDDGFVAKDFEAELKAPDLELNQLVEIVDVTDKVNAAVKPDASSEDAAKARRAIMGEIESTSLKETGLRSDVVTLFGGAKYHLYRYKKYTDVRLVWAPETKIAFFGGDADNFEYPRYCLDVTLFRVYEDGKPAVLKNYLRLSPDPLTVGQLIFVSGHPGRTQRAFTLEAMKFLRDDRLPYVLDFLRRKEILLQQYGLDSPEAARRARDELFGVQNSRKAYYGMLGGLQSPEFFVKKKTREDALLDAVRSNPVVEPLTSAWQEVAKLQDDKRRILHEVDSLRSRHYEIAETIHLLVTEDQKPSAERLREYRESNRESLLQDLLSPAPIYDDLEQIKLADELARLVEARGGDDALVLAVLAGKGPSERAAEIVQGTKMGDVEFRQKLLDGGLAAVEASNDPMLEVVRLMEPQFRRLRAERDRIEEEERQAYAQITKATVAVEGTDSYPDATFTLRLALGVVKGYEEDGQKIAPWTSMAEAYEYAKAHAGQTDYKLPESWLRNQDKVNGAAQFNFVSTADIIGGNSGSPVVDREGRFVGIIFDGNIQSLTSDYMYSEEQGRAVSVAAQAIVESLKSIYQAPALAEQLGK